MGYPHSQDRAGLGYAWSGYATGGRPMRFPARGLSCSYSGNKGQHVQDPWSSFLAKLQNIQNVTNEGNKRICFNFMHPVRSWGATYDKHVSYPAIQKIV